VHNKDENDFKSIPYEGVDTIWRAFKYQVQRIPNELFLGSRDYTKDESGPYVWKTWQDVDTLVDCLAKGIHRLNLLPTIENEGPQKFMGILSKNRWEWTCTELASVR
jgi:long-subunit acyl-CoA synthetase (AMP-forming)